MPLYDPKTARKHFIEDVLNNQPARHDLPVVHRTFWGTPSSMELNAQALIGVRPHPDQWVFWWLNLVGEMEPDENYSPKKIKIPHAVCPKCGGEIRL